MPRATLSTTSGGVGFILVLLASTFLMGSSFIAGKILLKAGAPPMLLVGWRFLIAALATLPLLQLDGPFAKALVPPRMNVRGACLVVLIGLLQTAAVMGLLFIAMQFISASTAAILLFTNPILVALLGWAFLGEPLHRVRVGGLIAGAVGVALAIGVGPELFAGGRVVMGEVIGLLSALCWATATIVTKRSNLPMGAWSLSFWQMLIGALVVRTSGYLFLAPLFTVALAFVVLGNMLTWLQALGGLIVGVALWMVNQEMPSRSQRERMNEARVEGQP